MLGWVFAIGMGSDSSGPHHLGVCGSCRLSSMQSALGFILWPNSRWRALAQKLYQHRCPSHLHSPEANRQNWSKCKRYWSWNRGRWDFGKFVQLLSEVLRERWVLRGRPEMGSSSGWELVQDAMMEKRVGNVDLFSVIECRSDGSKCHTSC